MFYGFVDFIFEEFVKATVVFLKMMTNAASNVNVKMKEHDFSVLAQAWGLIGGRDVVLA